jgi:hypothetical protein
VAIRYGIRSLPARLTVSDGSGRYRIESLRPGTYAVTFTLPGFSTARREGIELVGTSTATVDADLRVGAVTETITVSGAAPTVDTRSIRKESVISV